MSSARATKEVGQRHIAFAAFDAAHVASVEAASVGQFFLG